MSKRSTAELIKSSELAILGAVLMIGLGLMGILAAAADLSPTASLGRILIVCGFAYIVYAFATRDDGEAAWRVLMSVMYIFAGFYLLLFFSPGLEIRNVMVVVGVIVAVEGMMEFLIFYRLRAREGSVWIAAGAIATAVLVLVICALWPVSSMRLVGGIVGSKFVLSGVTRLMYSLALHKRLEAIAREQRTLA